VIPQRVGHAHERAAGADAGDEAVESDAGLLDELRAGREPVREDVAGVLELSGGEDVGVRSRVATHGRDRPVHALFGRGQHHLAAEPTDHEHPLTADSLRHVGPEADADRGAHHA
jgi:hypothetical protein